MAEQVRTGEFRGWIGVRYGVVADDRQDRLLPWPIVREITGISRTTAWRMQQTGDFPNPVAISANRVGWWESDLTAWKAERRTVPRPRPRPFPSRAPVVEPKQATADQATEVAIHTGSGAPAVNRKPMVQKARPMRQARPRAVSPDQIDFGF